MERAHPETVKIIVKAGRDLALRSWAIIWARRNMVAAEKRLDDLGCDYVIHHIGYDERRGIVAAGGRCPSPLDQLREVVAAVSKPVQAVAVEC